MSILNTLKTANVSRSDAHHPGAFDAQQADYQTGSPILARTDVLKEPLQPAIA